MRTESARLASLLALFPTPHTVLDLGCGACTDLPNVNFYGAQRVIGVDRDPLMLRWAKRLNDPRLYLVYGNVAHLPFVAAADLIIIRHPDAVQSRPAWATALATLPGLIRQGGHILLTAYEWHEIDWIKATIQAAAPTLIPFPLPDQRLFPAGLAGRDRFCRAYHL